MVKIFLFYFLKVMGASAFEFIGLIHNISYRIYHILYPLSLMQFEGGRSFVGIFFFFKPYGIQSTTESQMY